MFGIHCPGPSSVDAVRNMQRTMTMNSGLRHSANMLDIDTPLATRSVTGNFCPKKRNP